jgi:malonyl-CoA/methylmalonyl-CoA synthetase
MTGDLFATIIERVKNRDAPFLETAEGQVTTYRDFLAHSARFAHALRAAGARTGDRVLVQVEKSQEALALYIACLRAGAIFVPLNTAYTIQELEYFIADADPALIVCRPPHHHEVQRLAHQRSCLTLDEGGGGSLAELSAGRSDSFPEEKRRQDDIAAILYTSGTTGRSKGAMLSHRNLVSNAETLVDAWRFTAKDILIHALPIFHTHGLFVATNVTLLAAARMLFLPKFDPHAILRLMPGATVMMGVPTFYVRLLQHPELSHETCANMRLFISGSAALLPETHKSWRRKTGHSILERYGMTETSMITSNPYDGERVPGSVGFALRDIEVRVTDPETGRPLAAGEIGVIEVKGPNVFTGYWRNPEKTKTEFRRDGFFITGDLGRFDEHGYLHIVGRSKDLIITGGYNVYPKEVELELDALPGILESAVIGLPHEDYGEAVTALLVSDGSMPITEELVLEALRSRLARFKQPKRVLLVDSLPRNAMGKVQKEKLRQQYRGLYAAG